MESVGFSLSHGGEVPRKAPTRLLRAPWRRGVWSSAEVAVALQAQRAELVSTLGKRGDARSVAPAALEEVVNDAICIVVMMRKPIRSEEHLLGAFWTATRMLLRQYHEGRHTLRVGSRRRVALEDVAARLITKDSGPEDLVALRDRVARAADFAAQLTDLEREVVAVMAIRGAGVKRTAHLLGASLNTVKAAHRSAQGKLDRVALIAAAGRMCGYRREAITAYARGSADTADERAARAHLAACAACRRSYMRLVREMRGRSFQRDTAAAFLPAPLLPLGYHLGLLGRIAAWGSGRPIRGGGERAAELLGGAGVVKVAAAGSAVAVATATIAGGLHTSSQRHHDRRHTATTVGRHVHVRGAPTRAPTGASTPALSTTAIHSTATSPQLTPGQRAEREFGLAPSKAQAGIQSERATTASAHPSGTPETSSAEPTPTSSVTGSAAARNEATQAAREFGQP
jgi:Putative zinc-finger